MQMGWKVLLPMGLGVLFCTGRGLAEISLADTFTLLDTTYMAPVATPFFFYLLSGIMLIGGILVITRKNPVHSALALIVTLLAQASIYLMLYAPFVAGVQIILYAGGIMVLFLFVIMLVSIDRSMKERQFNSQWVVGIDRGNGAWADYSSRSSQREGHLSGTRSAGGGKRQHAEDRHHVVRAIHVRLRDRFAAVAGGDYRSGSDGKEENLRKLQLYRSS